MTHTGHKTQWSPWTVSTGPRTTANRLRTSMVAADVPKPLRDERVARRPFRDDHAFARLKKHPGRLL
jgi:hypothetical protein